MPENGFNSNRSADSNFVLDIASAPEAIQRHGKNTLNVNNLCYDVDERGMEWWQKLASFQIPWHGSDDESKKMRVLKDITFELQSGQMLAVLGSSGAGKTSLLDAIACQTTCGEITGKCEINGSEITATMIKHCSAYVRQNDRLLPHVTVKDTLMFVAQLKLPKSWSNQQIEDRVDGVIAELGLRHVSSTKVGGAEIRGLSGGERRRVSIGIQLLLDPDILFLDEPTSGLDAFTAHHLMETLARLAENNRIVILSIHQPRSDIFELFDMTLLLSQGRMVYYGKATAMVEYFTRIGYPCPPLTNPCDFYVDLTTVDRKSDESQSQTTAVINELADTFISNRKDTEVCKSVANITEQNPSTKANSASKPSNCNREDTECSERTTDITKQNITTEKLISESFNMKSRGVENLAFHDGDDIEELNNIQSQPSLYINTAGNDKANKFDQFSVLIKRSLKNNLEDYHFLGVQTIGAICMSLIIAIVFYGLELDQIGLRDRFGLLYMVNSLYPYMVMLDVIGQFYREKHILYFEMIDGLYTTTPYFFAKILCVLPEHTMFVSLYVIPIYFMTDLQPGAEHFFLHFMVVYINVYCSRSLAYWGSTLLPTYQLSVLFSQTMFTLFLLSCGFIFNLDNLFIGVKWTQHISYLKWGFQTLCTIEYTGLNFTCNLEQKDSCISTGEEALAVYSLDGIEVWFGSSVILCVTLIFLISFYVSLRHVSQKPQQE